MSNEEDIELELENGDKACFYSTESACQYMGVSYQTMNRRRESGHVKVAGQVGISYLYTKVRLDECYMLLNLDRTDDHVDITERRRI
jgi:hypothetical protein